MEIRCDICGGPLVMMGGGKGAVCRNCGMEHSIERVREMLGVTAAPQPAPAAKPVFEPPTEPVTKPVFEKPIEPVPASKPVFEKPTAPQPAGVSAEPSFGIPMEKIRADAMRFNKKSYRADAELAAYLGTILQEHFREYPVRFMVDARSIGPADCEDRRVVKRICFLVYKHGKPSLAIMPVSRSEYRTESFRRTERICARAGITYMRFFTVYPNEEDYVIDRIRAALADDVLQAKRPEPPKQPEPKKPEPPKKKRGLFGLW